jgi:hypothetical protein
VLIRSGREGWTVTAHPARRAAAAKCEAIGVNAINKRDLIYDGMRLDDFWRHADALQAKLTRAELAAVRLYTGPPYQPLNAALRAREIIVWATTITLHCKGPVSAGSL